MFILKRILLKPIHARRIRVNRRQLEEETNVLTALGTDDEWTQGYDLHEITGYNDRRLYNILARLEESDMVKVEWDVEPPENYPRDVK